MGCQFQIGKSSLPKNPARSERKELKELKEVFQALPPIVKIQELPMTFTITDENKNPVPWARLIIEINKAKMTVLSDEEGQVYLTFTKDFLSLNPVCWAEKEGYTKLYLEGSTRTSLVISPSPKEGKTVNLHTVSTKGAERILEEGITIYYPPEEEAKAKRVLKILTEEKKIVAEILGIEPAPFGVLLTPEANPILSEKTKERVFPVSLQNEHLFDTYYWGLTHEWIEGIVEPDVVSYERDPFTRWIGDGLTEYAGYTTCQKLVPDSLPRIIENTLRYFEEPFLKGRTTFDLSQWKAHAGEETEPISPEELIGYPVSLYFWLKLTRHSGAEIIPQFLRRAQKLKEPKNKDLIALLSELTGLDIQKELKIDLKEASNFLRSLGK